MTALVAGTLLALLALAFVLYPLFREPLGVRGAMLPRAGSRGGMSTAVDALREIEFDHVTGKLSESDYAELKAEYTTRAVSAMRVGEESSTMICERCGPRPEPNAMFCSECGSALSG